MKKWRVMNREAICLQLADKINHLKNNDKIISERLAGIRLVRDVSQCTFLPMFCLFLQNAGENR
nr:hypothetical protein A9Y87_12235 [Salmonella enterica subsp. enterica]